MEGAGGGGRGDGGSLFQREAKLALAGRLFSWRAQGGFRFPPLGPSKPPVTPFKRPLWGLAAPGAGPPPQRSAKGWLNLPAKRGKTEEKALIQRAVRFS